MKLTVDELIAELEKAQKSNKDKKSTEGRGKDDSTVIRFIKDMDVRPGDTKVPTFVIFYYYKQIWKGVSNKNKATKMKFFITLSRHFERCRTEFQRYYKLDGSSFDLSREGLLEAKAYDKQHEAIKKGKRKVPKFKTESKHKT